MRKLATIQRVAEKKPIEGADLIEAIRINGWWVVSKKDEFAIDDLVCYFEIDSWIPTELAPFLSKGKEPKEYNGVKGERLRTVKLKGQISQGLILHRCIAFDKVGEIYEDMDVTELLGIQKYEAPIAACLAGLVRGNFPSAIPKTDQERCISGDTIIKTENGDLTIKEIVDNKMDISVFSYNHANNVIELKKINNHSVMTRKNCWVKITTKSGKELIVTKNHKIWCDDILAYREASELNIGQKIITKTD